jgi:hypothetical protein
MPGLAFEELVTKEERAVMADAETGRIDAAGPADPDTAPDAGSSMGVSPQLWVWWIVRAVIVLC